MNTSQFALLLLLFALVFGTLFYAGCFYFSSKLKKPVMYRQIKSLAREGDRLAKKLLLAQHLAMGSAVAYAIALLGSYLL